MRILVISTRCDCGYLCENFLLPQYQPCRGNARPVTSRQTTGSSMVRVVRGSFAVVCAAESSAIGQAIGKVCGAVMSRQGGRNGNVKVHGKWNFVAMRGGARL